MKRPAYYVVDMRNEHSGWPTFAVRSTREEAIEVADEFFRSYGFKTHPKHGAWDPNQVSEAINEDSPPAVCFVFDNVKIVKGKVAEFMHFGGEGPCCNIHRTSK